MEKYTGLEAILIEGKYSVDLNKLIHEPSKLGENLYILLDIHFKNNRVQVLQIYFQYLFAYRNTNESYLLKRWDEIAKDNTRQKGFFFNKVENSTFLEWFNQQSYGIYEDPRIIHYAIHTPNDCIDVLSAGEPEIKWLDDERK